MNIPEKLNKVDEKTRYYIFIGILVFVFLLDYVALMRPQIATLMKVSPENRALSEDIKKAKEDISKLDSYKGETGRLKKTIEEVSSEIKSKDEISLILENVSRLANQNGIKIDQIMPFSQNQELLLEDAQRAYLSLPILVEARSGYHDFGRFLSHLEREEISLGIRSFSIAATNDTKYHSVRLNIEAIVYEEKK